MDRCIYCGKERSVNSQQLCEECFKTVNVETESSQNFSAANIEYNKSENPQQIYSVYKWINRYAYIFIPFNFLFVLISLISFVEYNQILSMPTIALAICSPAFVLAGAECILMILTFISLIKRSKKAVYLNAAMFIIGIIYSIIYWLLMSDNGLIAVGYIAIFLAVTIPGMKCLSKSKP